jgi:indolepyruvate ferredoxin oxidoreductase
VTPASLDRAVELARLPDQIRGYEQIKLGSVARFRARADELMRAMGAAG